MPRKVISTEDIATPAAAPVHPSAPAGLTTDEKLDLIVHYLHQMNNRDRVRTIGGFFKTLIGLIPILILVWSTWYFYKHGPELMEQITKQAVQQSAEYSQDSLMRQLEDYMQ